MCKLLLNSVSLLSVLTAGCAQTVELTSNSPVGLKSPRLQRIAVLDFSGPEKHAAVATQHFIERLRQSGVYEVVNEATLQQAAPDMLRDTNGRLRKPVAGQAGRRMRLDALVVGSLSTRDSRSEGRLRFGYPVVSATTTYTWVELPSGRVRDSHRVQHAETIKGGGDALPKCVAASVDQITKKLAPHLEVSSRQLAGGTWFGELSKGNRLAAEGNWKAAEAAWNQVVRDDPDNDGAWYNLGLAAEALGDHGQAQHRYRRALDIDDREQYQMALNQVEQTLSARRVASIASRRR